MADEDDDIRGEDRAARGRDRAACRDDRERPQAHIDLKRAQWGRRLLIVGGLFGLITLASRRPGRRRSGSLWAA